MLNRAGQIPPITMLLDLLREIVDHRKVYGAEPFEFGDTQLDGIEEIDDLVEIRSLVEAIRRAVVNLLDEVDDRLIPVLDGKCVLMGDTYYTIGAKSKRTTVPDEDEFRAWLFSGDIEAIRASMVLTVSGLRVKTLDSVAQSRGEDPDKTRRRFIEKTYSKERGVQTTPAFLSDLPAWWPKTPGEIVESPYKRRGDRT